MQKIHTYVFMLDLDLLPSPFLQLMEHKTTKKNLTSLYLFHRIFNHFTFDFPKMKRISCTLHDQTVSDLNALVEYEV